MGWASAGRLGSGEPGMQGVTATVGLGIAKSVFQVHGVDAAGNVIIRRQLKRRHVLTFFQKLPCAYRKLCPAVLMVQATEDRHRRDTPGPLDGAGKGSVLPQR